MVTITTIIDGASDRIKPFLVTTWVICKWTAGFLIIGCPVLFAFHDIPVSSWPDAYLRVVSVFSPVAFSLSIMALLFGLLATSKIRRPICALLFGCALPAVFIALLSLSFWIFDGIVIHGLDTADVQAKALLLYLSFSTLGALFYWQSPIRSVH